MSQYFAISPSVVEVMCIIILSGLCMVGSLSRYCMRCGLIAALLKSIADVASGKLQKDLAGRWCHVALYSATLVQRRTTSHFT